MRIGIFCGVLALLLSNFCLVTAAQAQSELRTPDCINPQEPGERVCCQMPLPQTCQPYGYSLPGDQSTPASSIPPLNEIALLAPLGATIGMQVSDLDGKLKARGLRRSGCSWRTHNSQDVSLTFSVSLVSAAGTPAQNCVKDLPVHTISFSQNESRKEVFSKLPLPAEMAAAWIKRFGEPASESCTPYPTPAGSRVICIFENVSADIKRLNLTYDHHNAPINRSASLNASITGFDRNETAESAIDEKAGAADPQSIDAVLASQMSDPRRAKMACSLIKNAIDTGSDASVGGVAVVKKGELLTDMPEACKN